ncbi:hypothetical protein [Novosphingobium cyanobacteriorum]|uniref:MarR family transcriptional regulator n=1 Tax=Novosphingobium cyanobacteriorum TaxID=3024215 RepID=A0ABT6CJF3_9SPHN|nr:hypothetical protein [Novosphingobium cyanobacteriorum]MDF8333664.1 hypothetical protein [Novosphingobium cyanobacteriorum]
MGQLDALRRTLLAETTIYPTHLRQCLALSSLRRAWNQYREDRAITLGTTLAGAECAAERNAFLILLTKALPSPQALLAPAIAAVRKAVIRPLGEEARQSDAIVEAGLPVIDAVRDAIRQASMPADPLERVLQVVERLRYSSVDGSDALTATAHTPCWAVNLLATADMSLFISGSHGLPCPGLVNRRLFRADRTAQQRRTAARECMLDALRMLIEDIAVMPKAQAAFDAAFPHVRSNSRAGLAWLMLFGLGSLTAGQLARALPATKAGAGKVLRQLEGAGLIRGQGPYAPYVSARRFATRWPDWLEEPAA